MLPSRRLPRTPNSRILSVGYHKISITSNSTRYHKNKYNHTNGTKYCPKVCAGLAQVIPAIAPTPYGQAGSFGELTATEVRGELVTENARKFGYAFAFTRSSGPQGVLGGSSWVFQRFFPVSASVPGDPGSSQSNTLIENSVGAGNGLTLGSKSWSRYPPAPDPAKILWPKPSCRSCYLRFLSQSTRL